jgi:hypothetical protein
MNRNGSNGGAGSSSGVKGGASHDLQQRLEPLATGMEVDGSGGSDSSGSSSPSSCVTLDSSPSIQGRALPLLVFGCRRCLMYCMATMRDFPICFNCKQPNLFDIREEDDGPAASVTKKGGPGE